MESHEKALAKMAGKGNVLKGKNIEIKKPGRHLHTYGPHGGHCNVKGCNKKEI